MNHQTCCIVVPRCSTVIPVPNVKVEVKMKSKTGKHFTTDILLLTDSSVVSNENMTCIYI